MKQQWLFSNLWHLISVLPKLPQRKFNIEVQARTGTWDDNKTAMKTTVLRPTKMTTPPRHL